MEKQYKKTQHRVQQQFSNWKCNTISKGWALFGRDYVSLCTCLCVRVCACVLVCAHLHPPLAAESAKQRLRQRRRRQFVSCFPSADAAALATHERSSVVVIREAHCKLQTLITVLKVVVQRLALPSPSLSLFAVAVGQWQWAKSVKRSNKKFM